MKAQYLSKRSLSAKQVWVDIVSTQIYLIPLKLGHPLKEFSLKQTLWVSVSTRIVIASYISHKSQP